MVQRTRAWRMAGDIIRRERRNAGMSQARLGTLTGTSQSAIARLEKGERRLSVEMANAIAQALNCDPSMFFVKDIKDQEDSQRSSGTRRLNVASTTFDPSLSPPSKGGIPRERDLPVRGIEVSGDGRFFMFPKDARPVAYAYRPPPLEDVEDAYALYVFEDAMHPMFKLGWTLWVHPHQPPGAGDGIVIEKTTGDVIVRELVRQSPAVVTVREYSPTTRDFDIPTSEIRTRHRIVGAYSER